MQQQWMYKFLYFKEARGNWYIHMADSMPIYEDDEDSELPMPDLVDTLAMKGWEVVSAVMVDCPQPDLLLLILKCPRDQD